MDEPDFTKVLLTLFVAALIAIAAGVVLIDPINDRRPTDDQVITP